MSLSLPLSQQSASDFVAIHNPKILKRTITEISLTDEDWKGWDNIRVICRFRPPNRRELQFSKKKNVPDQPPKFETKQTIHLKRMIPKDKNRSSGSNKPFKCTLDSILQPTTTQKQVFYLVGQPMILSCLEGFNSTIFAYGQSGSGKTYTMFGPENSCNVDQFGLIPRCFIYLFQKLNKSLSNNGGNLQDWKVTMQLLQIYKRDLLDLLNPKSKAKLVIKTDFRNDSVFVQNLRSIEVNTVEESFAILTEAQSNRIVAGHALNAVSSRSHMVVMVNVIQRSIDGSVKNSKLNFGDLAGSEDLTKALGKNPDPERRQEAIAINSSLSALTTAISYLSKGKKPGYRDSALTYILKDSLGGNSKTVMFVACSPHIYNRNETIRALRFAACAKKVKNKAKKNEEQSVDKLKKRIKELELLCAKLQAELVEARGKQRVFKRAITKMNLGDMNNIKQKSLSLALSPQSPPIKPGPIPKNKSVIAYDSDGGGTQKQSPIPMQHNEPGMYSMGSISAFQNMVNMVKTQHEMEEWSGSDEEVVISDDDINHETVDELLKDDGSEEELNYIHEISELRRKLDDASKTNNILNTEIMAKNIELEQCNNKIAQLMEEAENAQKEVFVVKRKLSNRGSGDLKNLIASTKTTDNDPASSLAVPDYTEYNDDEDNSSESIQTTGSIDDDEKEDGLENVPPIPMTKEEKKQRRNNKRPTIIDDNNDNKEEFSPPPIGTDHSSTTSVADGHYKQDSTFSFTMGNNVMLQYLMELQTNMIQTKQDMAELTETMRSNTLQYQESQRNFYNNMQSIGPQQTMAMISSSEEETEESSEENEMDEKKKKLEIALNRNLNIKKKNGGFCSSFSCFFGGESDDENNEIGAETSMLVEEYLKTHVRTEMKKQNEKNKKKNKKKKNKQRRRQLLEQQKVDVSYNFDNDILSVLTDSPTHSTHIEEFNPSGSMKMLHIEDDYNNYNNNNNNDENQTNQSLNRLSKRSSNSRKQYNIYVDTLGDSKRNVPNIPNIISTNSTTTNNEKNRKSSY